MAGTRAAFFYGIVSAICYSGANICLRRATHLDPVWVSQLKSIPLIVVLGSVLLWRAWQGQQVGVGLRTIGAICVAGLFGQLGGNILFQWALGVVGIALAVPVTTGSQIISSAIMGHVFLGDRAGKQLGGAAVALIAAITVLAFGAERAGNAVQAADTTTLATWSHVLLGICAACVSGASYSVLGVTLRHHTKQGAPITTTLFIIGLVGFCSLGSIVFARFGTELWHTTQWQDYAVLGAAGLFNVVAFATLTVALRVASVLFVNALSASQIAIAAISGVLLFHEPWTYTLSIGVVLTVLGLFLMRPRGTEAPAKPVHSHDSN
ncbi:MAG: DMT family transporter [Planctomycetales bacterium]|nr:DMT family transporter [Planctomycetales bacterium]